MILSNHKDHLKALLNQNARFLTFKTNYLANTTGSKIAIESF